MSSSCKMPPIFLLVLLVVAMVPSFTFAGASDESQGLEQGFFGKNLALEIARYCKEEFEEHCGVVVVMTRMGDDFVGLPERVDSRFQYVTRGYTLTVYGLGDRRVFGFECGLRPLSKMGTA